MREGVKAVVVHGDGRAFCSGLDVASVMHPMSAAKNMDALLHRPSGELSNLAQDVGYLWRRVPAPVIAVTHGVCFGGGTPRAARPLASLFASLSAFVPFKGTTL